MYDKVRAIVISSLKYSDNSLIVKCFTQTMGTRSYLLQGVLAQKKGNLKTALFQPFTLLELVATHKNNGTLGRVKEAKIAVPYYSLHTDMYKSAVSMFLSEVCAFVCTSEAPDEEMFLFLEQKLLFFDRNDFSANFHLKFLLDITRYLGFYPDTTHEHLPSFSLEDGIFSTTDESKYTITGATLLLFKALLHTDYPQLSSVKSNKNERNALLFQLLKYYEWHFPNFRQIKSLEVLQTLF